MKNEYKTIYPETLNYSLPLRSAYRVLVDGWTIGIVAYDAINREWLIWNREVKGNSTYSTRKAAAEAVIERGNLDKQMRKEQAKLGRMNTLFNSGDTTFTLNQIEAQEDLVAALPNYFERGTK